MSSGWSIDSSPSRPVIHRAGPACEEDKINTILVDKYEYSNLTDEIGVSVVCWAIDEDDVLEIDYRLLTDWSLEVVATNEKVNK